MAPSSIMIRSCMVLVRYAVTASAFTGKLQGRTPSGSDHSHAAGIFRPIEDAFVAAGAAGAAGAGAAGGATGAGVAAGAEGGGILPERAPIASSRLPFRVLTTSFSSLTDKAS